jgi:hypothetical protein
MVGGMDLRSVIVLIMHGVGWVDFQSSCPTGCASIEDHIFSKKTASSHE